MAEIYPFPIELRNAAFNWPLVYALLGIEPDIDFFSSHPDYWRVYVVRGTTHTKVCQAYATLGLPVFGFVTDLDNHIAINDRHPSNGSYGVLVRRSLEADLDLADLSANDLFRRSVRGVTVLEELLLRLAFHVTTHQHMGGEALTLCAGSRVRGGGVPFVSKPAQEQKIHVGHLQADMHHPNLRSRKIIEQ